MAQTHKQTNGEFLSCFEDQSSILVLDGVFDTHWSSKNSADQLEAAVYHSNRFL